MFQANQQINNYVLLKKLGNGSFCSTWMAEKQFASSKKKYVLKIFQDSDSINHEAVKEALRYGDFVNTIQSHYSSSLYVLPIIDAGIYQNPENRFSKRVYVVSRYIEGGSLADRLNSDKKLDLDEAIVLAIRILDGLEILYNDRTAHKNIKPSNILLDSGSPLLVDFDIFDILNLGKSNECIILPDSDNYLSPEALSGEYDKRSDLWAVGVILYEMLNGDLNWRKLPTAEKVIHIITEEFEMLPDYIPESIQSVVIRSLKKNPYLRYTNLSDMRRGLQKAWVPKRNPNDLPEDFSFLEKTVPVKRLFEGFVPNGLTVGKLEIIDPPEKREIFYLYPDSRIVAGRARGNEISTSGDAYSSRQHCVFTSDNEKVYINPLPSHHGTFVNDEMIDEIRELKNDDKIKIGQTVFQFTKL